MRAVPFSLVAIIILVALTSCQSVFLYHPTTSREAVLLRSATGHGLEPWPEAGPERMGWRRSGADGDRARLLVMHGNAGHSLHRQYYARGFEQHFAVYLLEYPGYGSRDGRPGEDAFVAAAVHALERLREEDPDRPVFILGESIGTGVATQVAARYQDVVPGVLLVTPFTNIVDVGRRSFPGLLVRAVLRDRFDSETALSGYRGRVGFLLAGQDEVVSTELGQRLYDGFDGEKRLWVQERAGHNTLDFSPNLVWWQEAAAFLRGQD